MVQTFFPTRFPTGGLHIMGQTGAVIIMDKQDYDIGTMDRDEFLRLYRLLEAAPELLEALQQIKKITGDINVSNKKKALEAWQIADAAIAKATGEKEVSK